MGTVKLPTLLGRKFRFLEVHLLGVTKLAKKETDTFSGLCDIRTCSLNLFIKVTVGRKYCFYFKSLSLSFSLFLPIYIYA